MAIRLYHVTPTANVVSILEHGINPQYSRGREKVSWFVAGSRVMWAIGHISARHKLPASEISVLEVDLPETAVAKTSWIGVYKVKHTVRSRRFVDAETALRADNEAHDTNRHDIPW